MTTLYAVRVSHPRDPKKAIPVHFPGVYESREEADEKARAYARPWMAWAVVEVLEMTVDSVTVVGSGSRDDA